MATPSQEDVDSFLSFCEIVTGRRPDPKLAPRYIKDANGDLDRAIGNFEQDPNRYAADKYDETLFSQDRDGGSNQYAGVPSFQIDHPNESLAQYPQSTAATRPNTPSNSMHDSGMADSHALDAGAGQETGVVGASGVQFGPATREYYEQNQWAMTTVSSTVPDPPPAQRKREPGEPAFIKPLPSQDYLPSLLTILNAIPRSHNALLMKGHSLPHYGQDPQWWAGNPIAVAQTIDLDDVRQDDARLDIIHETQRIMAFLDYTDRAYGSVEPLNKIESGEGSSGDTEAVKFLEAWHAASSHLEPGAGYDTLFETTARELRSGEEVSSASFKCLMPILSNRGADVPASLYDVLDETIWSNDLDGSKDVHASISSLAEILVMVVKQPDSTATGLNMTIPSSWYVDRYMSQNETKAKQMRRARADRKNELGQIQAQSKRYSNFHYNGTSGSSLDLLEVAMSAMAMQPLSPTGDPMPNPNAERDARLHRKIQRVYDRVKRKLEVLKTQEEEARKAYDELSSLLKEPIEGAEDNPTVKYQLCGISSDPAVTYIRSRRNLDVDQNMGEAVAVGDSETARTSTDWWRIHYDSTGQISKSRISEVDVLAAAAMENREVLLVYASEKALSEPFQDAPQALAEFVSVDNMLFREELTQDAEQPPPYDGSGSVGGGEDADFTSMSAKEWYGEGQQKQPEMAEMGAGLVAEMAAGASRSTDADADAAMPDAGGASSQHIEFAEGK
ncbi:ubiquitin interaction motif protein [Diplodia corticola]|uniref:Ubiquitin interaction motif protein n=1 Tax=Diplodia corticola TaxID=236234 RepID=A0A1J9REY0_9PEZI|nr:ubiquitin interaction motif protein [Diplodia corticola]OJD38969.1 ubiquitin interaction motif protein [Diplodia corticola]